MKSLRRPSVQELGLLRHLVNKSILPITYNWEQDLLVSPMRDGGMGSLYLFSSNVMSKDRHLGKQVSEFQFTDEDGIEVLVALNVDKSNELFELDIWKTDFNPVLRLPTLV